MVAVTSSSQALPHKSEGGSVSVDTTVTGVVSMDTTVTWVGWIDRAVIVDVMVDKKVVVLGGTTEVLMIVWVVPDCVTVVVKDKVDAGRVWVTVIVTRLIWVMKEVGPGVVITLVTGVVIVTSSVTGDGIRRVWVGPGVVTRLVTVDTIVVGTEVVVVTVITDPETVVVKVTSRVVVVVKVTRLTKVWVMKEVGPGVVITLVTGVVIVTGDGIRRVWVGPGVVTRLVTVDTIVVGTEVVVVTVITDPETVVVKVTSRVVVVVKVTRLTKVWVIKEVGPGVVMTLVVGTVTRLVKVDVVVVVINEGVVTVITDPDAVVVNVKFCVNVVVRVIKLREVRVTKSVSIDVWVMSTVVGTGTSVVRVI
jgi:hypothetical protein